MVALPREPRRMIEFVTRPQPMHAPRSSSKRVSPLSFPSTTKQPLGHTGTHEPHAVQREVRSAPNTRAHAQHPRITEYQDYRRV